MKQKPSDLSQARWHKKDTPFRHEYEKSSNTNMKNLLNKTIIKMKKMQIHKYNTNAYIISKFIKNLTNDKPRPHPTGFAT